jgi:hypothetical protein
MKISRALTSGGFILLATVLAAQTNHSVRWSPLSWGFIADGVRHDARIDHAAVLATKPWDTSKPLPLSFPAVERVARAELRKLVANDRVWEVTGFDIHRLQSPLNSSNWFYAVHFRSTVPRQEGSVTNFLDQAFVFVDFNGKPGFFDNN